MPRQTRRSFLKRATFAGLATQFTIAGTSASGRVLGANDRFRIGVCGLNGRGQAHAGSYAAMDNVELAYVIDPDERVMNRAVGVCNKRAKGYEVQGLADVREALDDKNLDAISVATPNHWHSLMVIWAAQAGKHCYVEKPASHDIHQGRVALEAWKKYGIVVQHGTQNRSDAGYASLHKAIQDGQFGRLNISYGYACKPRRGIGFKQAGDPPSHLDWNLWRGPACIDYHGNLVHYNWHWFWPTGNGDLNNQGTHQLDMAMWPIDADQGHPVRAMAIGGRFQWDDQGETPNTLFGIAQYPNGQYVFFNVRNVSHEGYQQQVENEYYFEDGGKIIRRRYYAKGSDKPESYSVPKVEVTPGGCFGSFVVACRAGKPELSNCDMDVAHRSCVLGHLMNNSYRLGKPVPFNEKAGRFGDNKDAYEHFMKLHEIMRDGVGIPEDKANYIVGPWLDFDPKTERFTGEHADEANELLRDPYHEGFEIPEVDRV